MSDWQQGPGTTTVMPPAPPAGVTPGTSPSGGKGPGGVPLWVLIIALLATVLVTGAATYLLAGASGASGLEGELTALKAKNDALTKQVSDLSAAVASAETAKAAAEASAAAAAAAGKPGTTTPTTEKQFTFINKVTWSSAKGYQLVADYAQMLTGKAAADAATAHGDESPPPNDYYIVNDNKLLRTFPISKTAVVTVLGWAGADATAKKTIAVGQFMDIMPGGVNPQEPWKSAPYYITIVGGTVTKIEQFYIP